MTANDGQTLPPRIRSSIDDASVRHAPAARIGSLPAVLRERRLDQHPGTPAGARQARRRHRRHRRDADQGPRPAGARVGVASRTATCMLSVVLRPDIASTEAPQIALVAGLAVAETVREWAPRAAIKWPNDVLIDGRKVAGILDRDGSGGRTRALRHRRHRREPEQRAADDFPPELRDKAIGLCTRGRCPRRPHRLRHAPACHASRSATSCSCATGSPPSARCGKVSPV